MNKQDKIWELYERTVQDLETLKHFCKDNPQALKQLTFIDVDIMNLRERGLKK